MVRAVLQGLSVGPQGHAHAPGGLPLSLLLAASQSVTLFINFGSRPLAPLVSLPSGVWSGARGIPVPQVLSCTLGDLFDALMH